MVEDSNRREPPKDGQETPAMASITIRNLDDGVKSKLRVRAATNGRSMEEEARNILRQAVEQEAGPRNLARAIRERFAPYGGVELNIPPREPMREPPTFD
jgi:plasmid stability protein